MMHCRYLPRWAVAVVGLVFVPFVTSSSATADATTKICDKPLTHSAVSTRIWVPDGATCTLQSVRVDGTIGVGTNARLIVLSSRVNGSVESAPKAKITVYKSSVAGHVRVDGAWRIDINKAAIGGGVQRGFTDTRNRLTDVVVRSSTITGTSYLHNSNVIVKNTTFDGEVTITNSVQPAVFDRVTVRNGYLAFGNNHAGVTVTRSMMSGLSLIDIRGRATVTDNELYQVRVNRADSVTFSRNDITDAAVATEVAELVGSDNTFAVRPTTNLAALAD